MEPDPAVRRRRMTNRSGNGRSRRPSSDERGGEEARQEMLRHRWTTSSGPKAKQIDDLLLKMRRVRRT